MTGVVRARRVVLATGSAVLVSGAWYAALTDTLARYDPAYAEPANPAYLLPVELVRSGAVAGAVAVLVERTGARGSAPAMRLGLGLWATFPLVLLTGSVVHEHVPWPLAAIHAGDWLVKLLLISAVVGRGALPRVETARRWRRAGRRPGREANALS